MITHAERSRASRLRRKLREGHDLRAEDIAWLEDYESRLARPPRGRSGAGAVAEDRSPPPPPAPAPEPPHAAPEPTPARTSLVPLPAHFFGDPPPTPPGGGSPEPAPKCPVGPDCPQCRGLEAGAQICATTGRRVWPRMTPAGARAAASILLGILAAAIRLLRPDRQLVLPTEAEVSQLAEAIREVSYRRASWIGAVDDLLGLGWGVSRYSLRALRAPDRSPDKPQEPHAHAIPRPD